MNRIPLSSVPEGTTVRIVKMEGGRGLTMHLVNMGLLEGEVIKVYHNSRGQLIIGKDDFRLALGRGMSQKILVKDLSES